MLNPLSSQALHNAMSEQPNLSLNFYSFGITLRKCEGDLQTEYPIDPAQVMQVLSTKITFTTGLLSQNTLYVHQEGISKTVAEYRPPQVTGVFMDDSEIALRVPLPGLVMIRRTQDDHSPNYTVYAVKKRPETLETPLFHAPLPNVFTSGSICWGSVKRVSDEALQDVNLAPDWAMLLGSPFGNHAVNGKSKSHPDDIRQKLIALEAKKARRYPISDLIPARKTFGQLLEVRS